MALPPDMFILKLDTSPESHRDDVKDEDCNRVCSSNGLSCTEARKCQVFKEVPAMDDVFLLLFQKLNSLII